MNDSNFVIQNSKLFRQIAKLPSDEREELVLILEKVFSGEPITDQEREENPGMWTDAEKYFKFGRAREPINEI